MTNSDTHLSDSEFRKEELKTVKSRRRLYTSTFIIVMFVLLYLLGRALNILATPVAIVVWTTIIVFCLRGPVNYLDSKGHWPPVGNMCGLYPYGCGGNGSQLDALFANVRRW